MKYNNIIFCIVLFSFVIIACSKTNETSGTVIKTFDSFTVSVEGESYTKVVLSSDGEVNWGANIASIGVYSDMQAPVKFVRWDDGTFHGESVTGTVFYAYYPYDGSIMQYNEDNPLELTCYTRGSSGKGSLDVRLPMVSKSSDSHFFFKQTCGVLHFKIKADENHAVGLSLRGNNNEIFGPGVIDMKSETPVLKVMGVKDPKTTIQAIGQGDSGDANALIEAFIPVPDMVFQNGFTLEMYYVDVLNGSSKYHEKSLNRPVQISRGKMKSFSVFDIDQEIKEEEEEIEIGIRQDRDALIAFYNALGGDNWINNDNWCSEKPLSEWYGVSVNEKGRVEGLWLWNNNLKGHIPEEIGNLSFLQSLSLKNGVDEDWSFKNINIITGSIPESIGNLSDLTVLNLDRLMLSGPLPESMKYLTQLHHLAISAALDEEGNRLDYDTFTGQIPNWIGELTELESLTITSTDFEGPFPSLENLTQLRDLKLNANKFSGPLPELPHSEDLYWISMPGNYFSGPVPESYSYCLDAEEFIKLDIFENCLSGQLPISITNHPRFSEFTWCFLGNQRDGYKIEIDQVPASRYTYETLDGGHFNLGEAYAESEYTMLFRWAEWCNPSKQFLPIAMRLAEQLCDKGLQTIWSYAGGEEEARRSFMHESGLDKWPVHIVESKNGTSYIFTEGHAIWIDPLYGFATPFIEVVDKNGMIVFISDDEHAIINYPFSYSRNDLERFLYERMGFPSDSYESTDYSADGQVHTLQTATKGAGINVVLMGDAFSDRLIADGTYESVMRKAMDALFSEEPYKSFKDYFNVYYVDVVSKNEVYYGDSALDTWYGDGTSVGGDNDKVFEYAGNVLNDEQIDDALMIVMMNRDYYAGTCYMYSLDDGDYGRGPSISYFPTSSDSATFDGLVSHEAGGHGFAKLADEYAYQNMGAVTQDVIEDRSAMFPYGWWRNGDFTGDPTQVKWSQFIYDSRYEAENIGTYEGAFTYWTGAWRPTEESIMNHNVGGFNAPSRYAIWYRINKLAYGPEWQGTYEDFVEFDKPNRTPEAIAKRKAQRRNFVEKDFVPLAPPVVIEGDWREMAKR